MRSKYSGVAYGPERIKLVRKKYRTCASAWSCLQDWIRPQMGLFEAEVGSWSRGDLRPKVVEKKSRIGEDSMCFTTGRYGEGVTYTWS